MFPFTKEQRCNGGMMGPPDFESAGFPGTGQVKIHIGAGQKNRGTRHL